MPDEEIAEEGIISPTAPAIQDPLLRELLAENETEPTADTPQDKPLPLPAQSETVDCIVIGLGAGGAPLLARLAQAGLKVVALEAGPWHNPETDFATDEKAQDFLFWNDERLAAGADPLAMGKNNSGTGVGGSTLHYTAYTPRPLPDDLHIKRDFGQGEDWPLTYDDLAPYYEEVEQFIGVSGPTPYPWGPSRPKGYPLAALPLNSAAQLMVRGAEKLGIKTSPAANAALSGRYYQEGIGWREACTNRGFCQAGCSNGAKSSMDVTFIPLAVKYGADIRPNSYVTEIERNAKGEVAAVVYTQNGQSHRLACRNLFLCAGSVETPRLLLLNELALTSGQVGRNLMAHPGVQVWGTFADEVRPTKGIPGGLISQDTHRPKDADFIGGYLLQSIGVMPVTFSSQVARQRKMWGQPLRDYMRQFNHIAGINILGDCLPHADNYLELSDEKDGRQVAKPRLHFTAQENELRMNAHAEKLMRDLWAAAGATDIWSFPRYAHVIGTARMGLSGDDAVVDRNGRAFDVPNLYICDNSVFPSALSVNPALTIMALSLRTADKFLEQERRRDK